MLPLVWFLHFLSKENWHTACVIGTYIKVTVLPGLKKSLLVSLLWPKSTNFTGSSGFLDY